MFYAYYAIYIKCIVGGAFLVQIFLESEPCDFSLTIEMSSPDKYRRFKVLA